MLFEMLPVLGIYEKNCDLILYFLFKTKICFVGVPIGTRVLFRHHPNKSSESAQKSMNNEKCFCFLSAIKQSFHLTGPNLGN